jgi:predicted ATPase
MARIDSLPEGAKEILQIGSVIGREFAYGLIKEVTELPEQELLSRLSILKDSEVLFVFSWHWPRTTRVPATNCPSVAFG